MASTMSDAPSEPKPWWEGDFVWRPQEVPADEPVEELDSPPRRQVPDEPAEELDSPHRRKLVPCWRCRKLVDQGTTVCIFCSAPLGGSDLPPLPTPLSPDVEVKDRLRLRPALLPMLGFYVALLVLMVGFMIYVKALLKKGTLQNPAETLLWLTILGEVVSTLLVVVAVVLVPRPPRLRRQPIEVRAVAWACGVGALAFLLGLNLFYHAVLQQVVDRQESLGVAIDVSPVVMLLLICVQPAIVEELFFRYLALGTLRRYMGLHKAVLISSVMFGVAHVGTPASMPLLSLVGVGLGYLRVYTNGLALPMIVHFAHNLLVVLIASGGF